MHPLHANPSSREIVEEDVQTSHIHLDKAINHIQQQVDERFDKVIAEMNQHIGQNYKQMDNDKQTSYARYDSIIYILNKIATKKEHQPTVNVPQQQVLQVSLKTIHLSLW